MPLNSQELNQIYTQIKELGASTEPPEMRREKAARLVNAIQLIDGIPEVDQMELKLAIQQHGWPPAETLTTLLNLGHYDKRDDETTDHAR